MAFNPNATNFTTEINVINPLDYSGTPYFTANSAGVYLNGNPLEGNTATAAVTAFATGGQASATALTTDYNLVTTCATNFDSVKLMAAYAGASQTVKNVGAAILSVFPATGDAINALAANLSIDIPIGGEVVFRAIDATTWETITTLSLTAPTTQKGNLVIKAADNSTNTQTIITNASQAAARTLTIPDGGATTANFLLSEGAQTVVGVQSYTSPVVYDINTTITAFAGGGQASATALTGEYNNVTTVATAADSVKLLTAVLGQTQTVKNSGAATLAVFPNTSDSINALAVNLSVDIPVGSSMTFRAISATVWETCETLYSAAPTTQKGGLELKAVDNSANYTVTLSNAAFGQASVVSIPDVGAATGTLAALEGTQTFSGTKTFGAIKRNKATDAITAFATGGQASATALTSEINSITVCATALDSVKLPTSVAGMVIQVSNLGAAAAAVFPVSGDLIDSLAADASVSLAVGSSITFTCSVAGSWKSSQQLVLGAKYTTNTTTTTFAAGQLTGALNVHYHSTAATPGSIATRTATEMFADDPYARVGGSYCLRISNVSSGAATLTITAGSGVTLTGPLHTALDTGYREYIVTYTSATALVMQNVGLGLL